LDCEKVIAGLRESKEPQSDEGGAIDDDTRSDKWSRILEPLMGKSQPYFLFYLVR
jgi:hypothetical protein